MKQSQLALLIWVGILVAVLLSLVIGLRITVDRNLTTPGELTDVPAKRNWESQTVTLDDGISRIDLDGVWKVTLSQGDRSEIRIQSPGEEFWDYDVSGETLSLGFTRDVDRFQDFEAEIQLTDLSRIDIQGKVSLELQGWDIPSLVLTNEGFSSVDGENSRIGTLNLRNEGAMDVNFRQTPVKNASLKMEGAGNVEILMDGGWLEVDLAGLGNVSYWGEVSSKQFNVDGLGNIEYKE